MNTSHCLPSPFTLSRDEKGRRGKISEERRRSEERRKGRGKKSGEEKTTEQRGEEKKGEQQWPVIPS